MILLPHFQKSICMHQLTWLRLFSSYWVLRDLCVCVCVCVCVHTCVHECRNLIRTLCMLGRHSDTKLYPQPNFWEFFIVLCLLPNKWFAKSVTYIFIFITMSFSQLPMAHTYNPSYLGDWDWEGVVQGQPRQKAKPYFQDNESKQGWSHRSRVAHMPSRLKVLSSNPSTAKIKWRSNRAEDVVQW
jgi:hypothetical protein